MHYSSSTANLLQIRTVQELFPSFLLTLGHGPSIFSAPVLLSSEMCQMEIRHHVLTPYSSPMGPNPQVCAQQMGSHVAKCNW
jgi:hypothetical protein